MTTESERAPSHPESPAFSGLGENQAGAVVSRLTYLDQLLGRVDELARGSDSPFARERFDLTPDESALLHAFVVRARRALIAGLDALGLARPTPTGSTRWSATTALTFADVALGELTGEFLRGYGDVRPAAARAVEDVARELRAVIRDGTALLRETEPGGLAERVAHLAGPAGEVLRIVERLSTTRRLAAVRPLIAAAAERAGDPLLAVGIFGRVSAGKSSLINALLGEAVLPVGATPVTAVPVSIERGPASVVVELATGGRIEVSRDDLTSYVTEQGNPDNRRGVGAVRIRMPSAPAGIRLLDTPGVGSLSGGGPVRTFAWLPRCDLGIVLVAAGTPVGRDELALASGLVNAGIACRVLLSKADVLDPASRRAAAEYVQGDLRRVLGGAMVPDVNPVSSVPGADATLVAFRRDVLEPLAAGHVAAAHRALARRLRALVAATAQALEDQACGTVSAAAGRAVGCEDPAAGDALRAGREAAAALAHAAPAVLSRAADRVVEAWSQGESGRDAARGAILEAVGEALARVRDATRGGDTVEQIEDARVPPLFDAELLDTVPALEPPALMPAGLRRRTAAHRLAPLEAPLTGALDRYAARLAAWAEGRVARRSPPAAGGDAVAGPVEARVPELATAQRLLDELAGSDVATVRPSAVAGER